MAMTAKVFVAVLVLAVVVPTVPTPAATVQAGGTETEAAVTAAAPPAREGSTPFSHWTRNDQGEVTTRLFPVPAFRNSATGRRPVEVSARASADPELPVAVEGALRPVRFGRSAARLVELDLDAGPLTLSAPDLAIGTPQAQPSGADYADVATDTDLRYRVLPSGVKEELVLRSPAAPREFRFHLADPSGQLGALSAQPDGSYRFSNQIDQDVVLGLAAPFAYEEPPASVATAGDLRAEGSGMAVDPNSAQLAVVPAGDGYDLSLSVDPTWLEGKAFPVVLDPTITFSHAAGTMVAGYNAYSERYCNGGNCTTNFSADVRAGTYTDDTYEFDPARSFFNFDLSSIPAGSAVSAATFGLYTVACMGNQAYAPASYYCDDHSYSVELHQLDAAWDATTRWNRLVALTNPQAFASFSTGPFNIRSDCGGCFWMDFDVTAQVQRWVDGAVPNHGFSAKLSTEPANIGGPFWSYLGLRGEKWGNLPYLEVTHTPNEPTPLEKLGGGSAAEHDNQCSATAYPINCATGNFWHSFSDLAIPGRGPDLGLSRTYNSLTASNDGPFGFGWSSSYSMSLTDGLVRQENGSQVPFSWNGSTYSAPPRVLATLVKNADGTHTFTRRARERFLFSAGGQLLKVLDLNGYAATQAYNASGQLATVTDASGRALRFTYGANAKVASIADPGGRKVSYAYDASNNLTAVTDVGGGVTRFAYDAGHRVIKMTGPNQAAVTNTYDSASRVLTQVDPVGAKTTLAYGDSTTTITDPKGNIEVQRYTNGVLRALTRGSATPEAATWTYAYDSPTLGVTRLSDPNGHTTTNTYDARGNLTTSTDQLGRKTTFTYDGLNDLTSVTDPKGITTTMAYDAAGNLLSRSRPLLGTAQIQRSTYTYGDPARPGELTALSDPNGAVWRMAYDGAGNLTRAADPLGNATTFGYDPIGRRTSMVSPRGNVAGANPATYTTTYAYNAHGDLTAVTDPLGHRSTLVYDPNRNLTAVTNAKSQTTTYAYDAANQRTSVTRADGTILADTYDANGNLASQADGTGAKTTYGYDPLDRVISMADPLARTTRFGYDKASNRTSATDPDGRITTYAYDAGDQLKTITYSNGITPNVSFSYDANGQRSAMADASGTSTYTYDSLDRLTSSRNGAAKTVGYGYDLKGQLTSLTYPGGQQVRRGYDAAGRWTSVSDWLGHTTTFGYDPDDNLASQAYPNANRAALDYDPAARLMGIDHTTTTNNTTLASFDYSRDNADLLTAAASAGLDQRSEAYSYSALDQLTGVNGASYAYDAADNLTRLGSGATLAYDAANQATAQSDTSGTTSFAYDRRGNRTAIKRPSGLSSAYGYDQANRLGDAPATLTGLASGAASLAAGQNHSLALTTDGTVWAWGANASGQLGNNSTASSQFPVRVSGLPAGIVAVAAGWNHSLALAGDGTVWAWGANGAGQLGNNSTANTTVAVQVTGLSDLKSIAGGASHSLAVRGDGTVWAWGSNGWGQLGNNSFNPSRVPVQVEDGPFGSQVFSGAVKVAAGGSGFSLAVKADGSVWAWGNNDRGQLGNGTLVASPLPVQVRTGATTFSGAVAVAGGSFHAVALKSDGTAWAWGSNLDGQLGSAVPGVSSLAVQVGGVSGAVGIASGFNHGLARRADGTVWAWGANASGQLGNNTTTATATTTRVVPLVGSKALAAGEGHSLALHSDASASAWGANTNGQLASGSSARSLTPTLVGGRATYAYNGDGLRMAKTARGATTAFTWQVAEGLPMLLAEGATSYVYGPGGLPLERIDASGNVVYYHHDQLGSTRALTDQAGTVVATASYDAYGKPTASTGSLTQPFGFAGQYTDAESGLQYLRARYYDPATGQFLTRDPRVAESGQPYAYANNSPLNFTDPSGEIAFLAVAAIAWAAFEVGSAVVDAVSTAQTFADPCASGWDKAISGGLFAAGAILPGGGYSTGARHAKAGTRVAVNGETAATALGRAMHKSWNYGPGFRREFTLKAGGRVDAINFQTRHVIELKPNNPRSIRLGERQLDDYIAKLNKQYPGTPWTGSVVTYP